MDNFKISGIIPPLITPLTGHLSLDQKALERIIDHVIQGGVDGIFLLGSTGEGPSLTHEVKKHVIESGVKWVSDRVPVFINITSTSHTDSIRLAEFSSLPGADYAVLAPPYYFDMSQGELLRYCTAVADQSPIPILLYNIPLYAKTKFEPGTVWQLAAHENIVGIKDSSGSINYIHQLLKERKSEHFSILVGPELLLGESLLLGCDGGVCGGANLYPGLFSKFYAAAVKKKQERISMYQKLLEQLNTRVYQAADSPMSISIGLKYILAQKGICSAQMALPVYDALSVNQKHLLDELDREFSNLGY